MAKFHYQHGNVQPVVFMIVPLTDMIAFPVLFASALAARQRPATHKRLMLLAATVLLDAGFGRALGPYLSQVFGVETMLGVWFTFYASLVPMLLGAVLYDLVTRRTIHRAYLFGMPFMLVLQLFAAYVMTHPAWPPFAKAMIGVS